MTRIDMPLFDSSLIVSGLLFLNNVLLPTPLLRPLTALYLGSSIAGLDMLVISYELCDALDVDVFGVKYPLGHERNRAGRGLDGLYVKGKDTEGCAQGVETLVKG